MKASSLPLALCLLLAACQESAGQGDDTPEGDAFAPCAKSETTRLAADTISFVTGQAGGAGAEASTVVYALNVSTGALSERLVRDATSTDPLLFADQKEEGSLVLLERFVGKPSRLTVLGADNRAKAEVAGLPSNVWHVQRLSNGHLLAPGWDDGSLGVVDHKTGKRTRENALPEGLANKEEDSHITGSLVDPKGNIWLLSSGISLGDFTPSAAKLHKLSSDLVRVERSVEVPGCRNAYGPFVVFPSSSEAVLSCNPQYTGPDKEPENPVVHVSFANDTPVFKTLVDGKNTGVQIHDLGLLDNGAVLVSARATNDSADGWKGTFVSAKRFLLKSSPAASPVSPESLLPLAGQAVRLPKSKATLTSCVVDPKTARCVPKLFGVAFDPPTGSSAGAPGGTKPVTCTLKVDFKNDFAGFAQPLF